MKIHIVYDSFFGNTELIAKAISKGVSTGSNEVELIRTGEYNTEEKPELLIMGSPTRQFSSSPLTKSVLGRIGSRSLKGLKAATFDTRIDLETIQSRPLKFMVDKGGYAAAKIARQLKKKGAEIIQKPEGFFVIDEKGPLKEGEEERAQEWGRKLTEQE